SFFTLGQRAFVIGFFPTRPVRFTASEKIEFHGNGVKKLRRYKVKRKKAVDDGPFYLCNSFNVFNCFKESATSVVVCMSQFARVKLHPEAHTGYVQAQ